jgi:DNA-binding GntR family transcriptional regulator
MSDQNLAGKIAHKMRRDILLGNLAPGMAIKERDNATELGVSRTPMREAIRKLADEGLVILRPSRSPIVANPTVKEAEDAARLLTILELYSAELACDHATDEEIENVIAIQKRMQEQYDDLDAIDRFEIDMEFHRAIAIASHNDALAKTHKEYLDRLWRVRFLSARTLKTKSRVLRQHKNIAMGLKARDKRAVRREIQSHLTHFVNNIVRHLQAERTKI